MGTMTVRYAYEKAISLTTGAVAATTWDPTHQSNCAFTNSNRTALHTGGGNTFADARSVAATVASQKVYIEHVLTQMTFNGGIGFTSSSGTPSGSAPGAASVSVAFYIVMGNGTLSCVDSVNHAETFIPALATGDRLDLAVDASLQKGWARKNGGAWNASHAGTQDPATGDGGFAIPAGPYYAVFYFDAVDGDGVTSNFSSGDWVGSAPSGFTQLAA